MTNHNGSRLPKPQNLFELVEFVKTNEAKGALWATSIYRYVIPGLGGPVVPPGQQVGPLTWEFAKTLPVDCLLQAATAQENYFEHIAAAPACRNRNRFYRRQIVAFAKAQGWLPTPGERPIPHQHFCRPKGQGRIYSSDVRTTNRGQLPPYVLGAVPEDYIWIEGQKILANPHLEAQFRELQKFGRQWQSPECVEKNCWCLRGLLGYKHRVQGVPLHELILDLLVPIVQLRFSEADLRNGSVPGLPPQIDCTDPLQVDYALSSLEALGQRRAKRQTAVTVNTLDDFFRWRQNVLAAHGQPEGWAPATKQEMINAVILLAKYQYREQTDTLHRQNFADVPVIQCLRQKIQQNAIDKAQRKAQIRKRMVPLPVAFQVLEEQRQDTLIYRTSVQDAKQPSGFQVRKRTLYAIARDLQQTLLLGLMLFVPTDRQQVYRALRFGESLRHGHFPPNSDEFIDTPVPPDPNDATYWLCLEQFKTSKKYGTFWYPVPNVEFDDGTTFNQFLSAWLFGFADAAGYWPTWHKKAHANWQGYIDPQGQRLGFRAALQPQHDYVFTQPIAKTPMTRNAVWALIRSLFVHFTQADGEPVAVSPHALRHMLATFLDSFDASPQERASVIYSLHHSEVVHQESYVDSQHLQRIAPAVQCMQRIIHQLL